MEIGSDTPWGTADYVEKIADGIYDIQLDDGYGGIMIDINSDFAIYELSDEARELAHDWNDWLCFGNDSEYMVAMWEIMHNDHCLDWSHSLHDDNPEIFYGQCRDSLIYYQSDYACAMGIE